MLRLIVHILLALYPVKVATLIFLKWRLGTWLVRRIFSKDRKTHDFCTKQVARLKAQILGLSPKDAGMKRKHSSIRPCSAVGSGNPDTFSVAVPHNLFDGVDIHG